MAFTAQQRREGVLKIENILTEYTASNLTLTANGDYVAISGSYENGDIIHISEPRALAGDYIVSQYDGADDLGFKSVYGLTADDINGIDDIKGYQVEMLPACWVTDFNLTMGTWNTEEITNGCGEVTTLPSTFERGEYSLTFQENWDIDLQLALKNEFQKRTPTAVLSFEPMGIQETGERVRMGIQETARTLVTALSFDRPNEGISTGTMTLKVASDIVTARIA